MAKKVRKIHATLNQFTSEPVAVRRKKKVAGYARVSTDREEQATSYEAQMTYYKTYIEGHEDWEFVGMYSDEGITATNTKKRDGFNQMVEDALDGKIDLIITKSVSRFARNTVDSLTTIRKLKDKGIEVYFEKENIWTLDAKGELMITIMSSLAQEESRSISENTTWGIKSPSGKDRWHISTVKSILTNEKYRGDALLQKQYTTDFLQKKRKTNNGEIPQYYVEEHHEAIIPPAQFDFVQVELARREQNGRYSGVSIFSNKIKCGCCGGWYGSKVWHSTDKYRKVIYRCNRKYGKDTTPCNTPHLSEEEIKKLFLKALNALVEAKEETIENLQELIETVCQIDSLGAEQERLKQELRIIAENLANIIQKNASVALDQTEQAENEKKLCTIYGEKHSRFQELEALIQEKNDTREILTNFINKLEDLTGEQTEFREELWGGLVDHIRIDEKSSTVVFRGGIEITI